MSHAMMTPQVFAIRVLKNIDCDDDDNDMEYTEDAIDNMILEFSGD